MGLSGDTAQLLSLKSLLAGLRLFVFVLLSSWAWSWEDMEPSRCCESGILKVFRDHELALTKLQSLSVCV